MNALIIGFIFLGIIGLICEYPEVVFLLIMLSLLVAALLAVPPVGLVLIIVFLLFWC